LILVVLLQSGKAGDLASAFGGAGTQTAFGARGAATVLSKATTVCAVVFMITSLALSITFIRGAKSGSVMEGVVPRTGTSTPAKPANPTGSPAQATPQQQTQPQQQQTPPPATPPAQPQK
jgi:preprotein translocase subunit SecG